MYPMIPADMMAGAAQLLLALLAVMATSVSCMFLVRP